MRRGYVCNSLHGGKDQTDRDQAIADFKNRVFSVLIATSVAARGLDVRGLNVVINYDCPNHMEDLVHRVGRTGRAGNKGDAYTFITPDQDRYASEVVKAMKLSHLTPPDSVQQLADQFLEKVRAGKERHSSKSGFGGKGLEKLDKERDMVKKIQKVSYGNASGEALDDDDDEEEEGVAQDVDSDGEPIVSTKPSVAAAAAGGEIVRRTTTVAAAPAPVPVKASTPTQPSPAQEGISAAASAALLAAQAAAQRLNVNTSGTATAAVSVVDQINQQLGTTSDTQAKKDAADIASALASLAPAPVEKPSIIPVGEFACELDINDYHQKARWRATNRETLSQIIEQTGAAITTRGVFVPPGKAVPEGERKLYLSIESDSERSVEQARNELKRILTEATLHIMEQEARGGSGRYSVV
ncbi:pre-mRNA processing RNA-helicase [Linderina macrospora]|uniref:Pre-mRNA processing RNA-helicase n=1 Tax=Linderina macrospora TaxID=4868 RepID=A0ACC1J2M5_9FUNG|nr:pre-mRNA processing RNA-helicase [Linderina macrospora]